MYSIKTDKEFVNTLKDNIKKRGAIDKLISDRAKVEVSSWVQDILEPSSLMIGSLNHTNINKTLLRDTTAQLKQKLTI